MYHAWLVIAITFNLFLISFSHYWFPRTILNLWHWSWTKSSDGVQSFHKKGWHCQPPHPTQPTSANPFYANLPVGVFFTVGVFAFCKPSSCQVTPPTVTPQIKGEYMQLHSNVFKNSVNRWLGAFYSFSRAVSAKHVREHSAMQNSEFPNAIHTMQCNLIKIQAMHRLVICTIQQNSS